MLVSSALAIINMEIKGVALIYVACVTSSRKCDHKLKSTSCRYETESLDRVRPDETGIMYRLLPA